MREGWTYKRLGECFPYIKNGANIKQIKGAKGYPITRIETLSGGVFNRDRMGYADIFDANKFQDYILGNGDLLMSHINSKAYIGRTVQYTSQNDEIIIHGMNLLRLRSNESVILSSFFKYYTDSWHFKTDIASIRKDAVNQSSFAISDLKNFKVPIPSLSEQQSIVAELDKINELISLKKAQLSDLDNLAQSIFYDMFGDPIENEKGWDVKKLGVLSEIGTGATPSRTKEDLYYGGGIPWVKTTEVCYQDIYDTEEKITPLAIKETNCKIYPVGTLLMAMYGQGKTRGQVAKLMVEAATNQACAAIQVDSKIIHIDYLYALMMIKYDSIRAMAQGGNQANLNMKLVGSIPVPLPPLSLQQEFAKRIELIEQQKAQISSTIKDLETLLASRMQYWFD